MRADFAALRAHLESSGQLDAFRALERRRPLWSCWYIVSSWLLIGAAIASVVSISYGLLVLALPVIGSRMRSLQNNLHDASHGAIQSPLVRWFLASSLFDNFASYREAHRAHHAYLADPSRDPDYLSINETCHDMSPQRVYLQTLLSWNSLLSALFGRLHKLHAGQRLGVLVWWTAALSILTLAAGASVAAQCFAVWMMARFLVLRPIEVFTELSDHVGLAPDSVISYTRNSPRNFASLWMHPHNDSYHLAHHLAPRVPLYNLRAAHELLLGFAPYRACEPCDSYALGPHSVARAWTRPRMSPPGSTEIKSASAPLPQPGNARPRLATARTGEWAPHESPEILRG